MAYQSSEERYLYYIDEVSDNIRRMSRNFYLLEKNQNTVIGFTRSQCYCLLELLNNREKTMQELSEHLNLNASTMTRIVNILVRDGYIQRTRNREDRRVVVVKLTSEGRVITQKLSTNMKNYYNTIIRELPTDQIDKIFKALSLLMVASIKTN